MVYECSLHRKGHSRSRHYPRLYSSRSAVGGANVKRAIYRTIALIGEHPLAGRKIPATETRKLRAGRYPYLIYWTIEEGEVWLLHIRHTAREPWMAEETVR